MIKNKKVGIITFHYSINYGGVLQAYALYKVLESLGMEVKIVDYNPNHSLKFKLLSKLKRIYQTINVNLLNWKAKIIINKIIYSKFKLFLSKINLTKPLIEKTFGEGIRDFNFIVVGSDQVWNPAQRTSNVYFVNYERPNATIISYAADSTNDQIDSCHIDFLKTRLRNFDHISVRNLHSQSFVNQIIGQKPVIVSDPTLLFDFEKEFSLTKRTDKYILVYILGKEIVGGHNNVIKHIRMKYGNIKVLWIAVETSCDIPSVDNITIIRDAGPSEWLDLFYNATFVYTDSYHGVLFSLKFHQPFLAYYTEKLRASRFVDLKIRFDISPFIITSYEEMLVKDSINKLPDFEKIDSIINELNKESTIFLESALMDAKENEN